GGGRAESAVCKNAGAVRIPEAWKRGAATGFGPSVPDMTQPVGVVLPCLDEAAALPWVLSRIPGGYRAIVADNGSTDGSPAIAARYGAYVVHAPKRGFGAAAHAGPEAATRA